MKLMETRRPDIMYLSTTDYIQHKHAPGTKDANEFYAMMDGYWGKLHAMDVTLALTADHGMKAKHNSRGEPNVIYLQSLLDTWLGEGAARVICPITDPYVVHHGALGGFVTVYLSERVNVAETVARIAAIAGIECALSREDGAARFELPPDRVGDVLVVAAHDTVIGTTPGAPRLERSRCAATLARWSFRATGTVSAQPSHPGPAGGPADSKLRYL